MLLHSRELGTVLLLSNMDEEIQFADVELGKTRVNTGNDIYVVVGKMTYLKLKHVETIAPPTLEKSRSSYKKRWWLW